MSVHAAREASVLGRDAPRPLLAVCPVPGCTTVTMGGTCVLHDPTPDVVYPRGRPFVREPDASAHAVAATARP